MSKKQRIVVIGAGFGGLSLAKKLIGTDYEVLLLDRNNYHTFQPLLYQVATGGLEPDSIAYPIRRTFRGASNIHFRMANVDGIEVESQLVSTDVGKFEYDLLVVAAGGTTNFFNFNPERDHLMALKSVPDALNMRSQFMQNLEAAISTKEDSELEAYMNVAIVGGGPTGVEVAGALAEMRRYVLPKDFPDLDFERMRIFLFEAKDNLLGAMSEHAAQASLKYLRKMGVVVELNASVKQIGEKKIILESGKEFATETVIWTAGVKARQLRGLSTYELPRSHRLRVDAFNKMVGAENVFAIGDIAIHETIQTPQGLPMLAPVAMQQGEHLAKNLKRVSKGLPMLPFRFKDKGVMATIGRNKAVVDMPRAQFHGRLAWLVWMGVHLFSLVGFRNKLVTLIGWSVNYFNYDRPLGLIIRRYKRNHPVKHSG